MDPRAMLILGRTDRYVRLVSDLAGKRGAPVSRIR